MKSTDFIEKFEINNNICNMNKEFLGKIEAFLLMPIILLYYFFLVN